MLTDNIDVFFKAVKLLFGIFKINEYNGKVIFKMNQRELSIIIPSYQKKEWLQKTIKILLEHFSEAEIIIINDGSQDKTKEIKDIFGDQIVYLENEKNQGKGFSLRKGFREANGQYLIFTDDDLPYGIESIDLVLKELKNNKPVVIGERQFFYDSFVKMIGRIFFNLFFKSILGLKIKDTQAGIKGFENTCGKKLFALSFINHFAIDLEILALCQKLEYSVTGVPVKQKDSLPTSLSLLNLLYIFIDTFRIKFHHYEIH